MQRAACGAIANLSLRYDDIRKQCVNDGVLKNIINAMSAHKVQGEGRGKLNFDKLCNTISFLLSKTNFNVKFREVKANNAIPLS